MKISNKAILFSSHFKVFRGALALAALSLSSLSASENALKNPGFEEMVVPPNSLTRCFQAEKEETIPTGWTSAFQGNKSFTYCINGNPVSADFASDPNSGDQYLMLMAWDAKLPSSNFIQQDSELKWADLSVGDKLEVSFYMTYRPELESGDVSVWLNDGFNNSMLKHTWAAAELQERGVIGAWQEFKWTHTVTQSDLDAANANSWGLVRMGIGLENSQINVPCQIAIDDVSLKAATP